MGLGVVDLGARLSLAHRRVGGCPPDGMRHLRAVGPGSGNAFVLHRSSAVDAGHHDRVARRRRGPARHHRLAARTRIRCTAPPASGRPDGGCFPARRSRCRPDLRSVRRVGFQRGDRSGLCRADLTPTAERRDGPPSRRPERWGSASCATGRGRAPATYRPPSAPTRRRASPLHRDRDGAAHGRTRPLHADARPAPRPTGLDEGTVEQPNPSHGRRWRQCPVPPARSTGRPRRTTAAHTRLRRSPGVGPSPAPSSLPTPSRRPCACPYQPL